MISERAVQKADEAKRLGKWLFDPSYKKWYSPEDFTHVFTYANAKEEFLNQLQIRHPLEGIEAGFKQVTELQTKLHAFTISVIDYYMKR